jgi:hypothetical protein
MEQAESVCGEHPFFAPNLAMPAGLPGRAVAPPHATALEQFGNWLDCNRTWLRAEVLFEFWLVSDRGDTGRVA